MKPEGGEERSRLLAKKESFPKKMFLKNSIFWKLSVKNGKY